MSEANPNADWRRTTPLGAIYLPPSEGPGDDRCNQQVVGIVSRSGAYVVTWTTAGVEAAKNQRVVVARSTDGGRTWSAPIPIDGDTPDDPGAASYSCLFQTPTGRIYVFYNKSHGTRMRRDIAGFMRWRCSDDDGVTWSDVAARFNMGRGEWTPDDPEEPSDWIGIYAPHTTSWGEVLFSFARYGLAEPGQQQYGNWMTETYFLRMDNILTEPDPTKLRFTVLPESPRGLRIERKDAPGMFWGNEPSWIELSDGRLVVAIRSRNDAVYYAVSSDRGRSWSAPEPLLNRDGGAPMRNPNSPCPLVRLSDGRIVLLFNNAARDGTFGPRNPAWIAVGRERPDARQPIEFGEPVKFLEVPDTPALGTTYIQVASYSTLVEHEGRLLLFYNDCKHWVLFREVEPGLLEPRLG